MAACAASPPPWGPCSAPSLTPASWLRTGILSPPFAPPPPPPLPPPLLTTHALSTAAAVVTPVVAEIRLRFPPPSSVGLASWDPPEEGGGDLAALPLLVALQGGTPAAFLRARVLRG